jgi:molecular chaperone DnaJ
MAKDYYQILGIDKKASKDEIKKAFRTLAHKYHPDKKGGDEAKFKEINEAYTVLSDDKKRAEFDAYGRVFSDGAGPGGQGGFGGFGGAGGFGGFDFSQFTQGANGEGFEMNFGDIFSEMFGGGRGARARRGRDISIDAELSFEESVFGVTRKILLNKTSTCKVCSGSGGAPGTKFSTCKTCNGKGKVREVKSTILGSFATERPCTDCAGSGKMPEEKCKNCHGAGVSKQENEISVKIPSGIEDGEMIRLTGAGESVSGGTAGDLYIKVHVKRHPQFRKDGQNLVTDLKVKLSDALLGAEYQLKTLDGNVTLKIPAHIGFGEVLRIKGKGVPNDRGNRGDLMVRVVIELPKSLSKNAKKMLEELKKEGV